MNRKENTQKQSCFNRVIDRADILIAKYTMPVKKNWVTKIPIKIALIRQKLKQNNEI